MSILLILSSLDVPSAAVMEPECWVLYLSDHPGNVTVVLDLDIVSYFLKGLGKLCHMFHGPAFKHCPFKSFDFTLEGLECIILFPIVTAFGGLFLLSLTFNE